MNGKCLYIKIRNQYKVYCLILFNVRLRRTTISFVGRNIVPYIYTPRKENMVKKSGFKNVQFMTGNV